MQVMDDEPLRRSRTLTAILFVILASISATLFALWDPDEGKLEEVGATVLQFMGGLFCGLLALLVAFRYVLITRDIRRVQR
jgi:RsiW-degrading membrane proteinase PrsW (M82 family)